MNPKVAVFRTGQQGHKHLEILRSMSSFPLSADDTLCMINDCFSQAWTLDYPGTSHGGIKGRSGTMIVSNPCLSGQIWIVLLAWGVCNCARQVLGLASEIAEINSAVSSVGLYLQ